jgi:hypothetical protein
VIETRYLAALFEYTRNKTAGVRASRWEISPARRPRIAICATPKSGSTWATNVLVRGLGVEARRLCYTYSSNEHDLYVPALLDSAQVGFVSQLHIRATPHNVSLMQDFNIAPVILTRNIFDAVVSFSRDLRVKLNFKIQNPGQIGYSFVWLFDDMVDWTDEQLIDYSIDYYIPWYMNFLRSWDAYKTILNAYPLRYEALKEKPDEHFTAIYSHFYKGPKRDFSQFSRLRFGNNKAMSQTISESGEGFEQLSEEQQSRIASAFLSSDSDWIKEHLEIGI